MKEKLKHFLQLPPLVLALVLQFVPLAKFVQSSPLLAQSPFAIVLQWTVGAITLLGACHAYSGSTPNSPGIVGMTRYTNNASGVAKPVAGTLTTNIVWTNGVPFNGSFGRWGITITNDPGDQGGFFNVLPLPPGLMINTNPITNANGSAPIGFLTNTPTVVGVYPVTLFAGFNCDGCLISNFITITILANSNLPAITSLTPSNPVAFAGTNVSFNVSATGNGTLVYQWQKNGSNIAGQNATNFPLLSITTNDAANYTVVVTNSSGAVTSSPTTLKVIPLPSLSVTSNSPGFMTLEFDQYSSASYYLEYKDDLNGANWLAYSNMPAALSNVHRSIPAAATNNARFFRERVTIP